MKMTRSELINALIKKNAYKSYLEIGVNTPKQPGYNWNSVIIETKHGVDPNPKTNAAFVMTSDEFFEKHISMKYDIVFVDGLHLFEQAYRDIMNSLKYLNDGGTIVVHDCNPLLEKTQVREHVAGAWHGDVWKAILKLRMEERDLSIYTIDTDEGCGIIQKGHQELLVVKDKGVDPYTFAFFNKHRKEILNLISVKEFKKSLGLYRSPLQKIQSKSRAIRYLLGPKYKKSYSQCGEDIIIGRLFKTLGISNSFYIDIGANDPVIYSNTYLFYKNGAQGICIEPNPALCAKFKAKRPRDIVLEIGIGAKTGTETYFMFDNNSLNTFSADEATGAEKKGHKIVKKEDVAIKTWNEIMRENSVTNVDLLSLDVEGLDLEILKSIDFKISRPKIICVETASFGSSKATQAEKPIDSFLETQEYDSAGVTPINKIFIDKHLQ